MYSIVLCHRFSMLEMAELNVVLRLKVLEKMRPLDHKLKYQIDKLVRTAVTGSLGKVFFSCKGPLDTPSFQYLPGICCLLWL